MNELASHFLFTRTAWLSATLHLLLMVGATSLHPTAMGQGMEPIMMIDLESTIKRTVETHPEVLRQHMEWLVDEAGINEIKAKDGWEFELRGEKEIVQGDRSNLRDSSRGNDPRVIQGELEEDEQSLLFALSKEFLKSRQKNKSDALSERLKQLDRTEDLVLAANNMALVSSLAYLDVYYGKDLSAMLRIQVAFDEENLRILKARLEHYEALQLDVLTTEVSLSTLRKRLANLNLKNLRKLDMLKSIWGDPDLQAESLAPPVISDATVLEETEPERLVQEAWSRRPDLGAQRTALSTLQKGASSVDKMPELEVEIGGRFRDHDRDFADTLREDSTFDVLMEFSLRIPLSLRKENEFRRKRHQLNIKSRMYEVEAQKKSIEVKVRQAHEDYKVACSEMRIQVITTKQFEEAERVTRLTAETMPETMKGNPDFEVRKATNAVLEARADLIRAEKFRMEMLLTLMAELGRLAPTPPGLVPSLPSPTMK